MLTLGFVLFLYGADGGTRTHKVSHTPLKRARLPVSPHPHIFVLLNIYLLSTYSKLQSTIIISNNFLFCNNIFTFFYIIRGCRQTVQRDTCQQLMIIQTMMTQFIVEFRLAKYNLTCSNFNII